MKQEVRMAAMAVVRARAQEQGLFFFHDHFQEPWLTVPVGNHRESWLIKSRELFLWIAKTLRDNNFPYTKPLVKAILDEFEMVSLVDGPMLDVFVRVGAHEEAIYLDLADAGWRCVEITKAGWRILKGEAGVKFRRTPGMAALPLPVPGGSCKEILRFLNVRPEHEILFLSWLTFCFRPQGPYPILSMSGPQGAGKSTSAKTLRGLMDPNIARLVGAPRDKRSLIMAASNSRLLCFDNMSQITAEMSDLFCTIAVGGAHTERKYYLNDGTMVTFVFQNPICVNGISELPERPDLLDRCLVVSLQGIADQDRRTEEAFWREFNAVSPRLLGSVLDAVVEGMERLDSVVLPEVPRMADFCRWGVAVESKLGYPPGSFLAAYRRNLADANAAALENSPVAWSLYHFLRSIPESYFKGTAQQLLRDLNEYLALHDGRGTGKPLPLQHPKWPKSASALSGEIARVQPNLGKLGIEVSRGRTKVRRWVELRTATDAVPMTAAPDDDAQAKRTVTGNPKKKQSDRKG